MKTLLLILIAILGLGSITMAQQQETVVVLKRGQQKSVVKGDVILKFVSVIEDSRCPEGVNCVWAGNAKIEVLITDKRGNSKKSIINTTTGPLGDQHNGYAIYLNSLTPHPKGNKAINPKSYIASFTIRRLSR